MSHQSIIVVLLIVSSLLLLALLVLGRAAAKASPAPDEFKAAVDVWEMQRELMERSDQRVPPSPCLHNGTVLYGALNLEELAEMCEHLSNAIAHYPSISRPGVPTIAGHFLTISRSMRRSSLEIRSLLKVVDLGSYPLTRADAKALFDDHEDLMVTNAGFGNAAGFPGALGYVEVQGSNLSKVNPATGRIDKTPDGKWIKGANYYEADLLRILVEHSPVWAMRNETSKAQNRA